MRLYLVLTFILSLLCSSLRADPLGTGDIPIYDENTGNKWYIYTASVRRNNSSGIQDISHVLGPGWINGGINHRYHPSALRCTVISRDANTGTDVEITFSWNGDILNPVCVLAGDVTLSRDNSSVSVTHGGTKGFHITWNEGGELSGSGAAGRWGATVGYFSSDFNAVPTTQPDEQPDEPTTQPMDALPGHSILMDTEPPPFEELEFEPPGGSRTDYPADLELPWGVLDGGPAKPSNWKIQWSVILPRYKFVFDIAHLVCSVIITMFCAWWILEELRRT